MLSFEGMTESTDAIVIAQVGDRTTSSITDTTIAVKDGDGRYAITTPRGTSVFNTNTPTYHFERLKFSGTIESAANGRCDYGWSRYIDLGDGQGHVIRDVEFFIFQDTTRATLVGPAFRAPAISSIYFKYGTVSAPETTVIGDKHTSGTVPFEYDTEINPANIELIGGPVP